MNLLSEIPANLVVPEADPRLRSALAVVNPVAGSERGPDPTVLLQSAMQEAGWALDVLETREESDLVAEIRTRVTESDPRPEMVVVAGGDGTVSMAAEALTELELETGIEVPLGIIPTGTANVLSRELHIPQNVEDAVALVAHSSATRRIDAMRVGKELFFLQVGIGIDALMIRDTPREAKRSHGRLAYMRTLFDKLRGHRSHTFYLAFDDTELQLRASQVVIANAGTLGAPPFTWGPHIDPSDGVLDLCVLTIHGPRDYMQIARNLLTGHRRTPSTRYFRVHKRIAIRTVVPMAVQADGETLGNTPVVIELVPDALKVVVPSESN